MCSKILNKKLLIKLDETRHVLTERDILTNTRSDWLVKLLYAFQDQEKYFLPWNLFLVVILELY